MNQVISVIIVLVILYMFKDKWFKYMPDIVKKNILVSGLVFGFFLCWLVGKNIEGFGPNCNPEDEVRANKEGGSCGSECDCVGTLICTDGKCSQSQEEPSRLEQGKQAIRDVCCPEDGTRPTGCFMGMYQKVSEYPELGNINTVSPDEIMELAGCN